MAADEPTRSFLVAVPVHGYEYWRVAAPSDAEARRAVAEFGGRAVRVNFETTGREGPERYRVREEVLDVNT